MSASPHSAPPAPACVLLPPQVYRAWIRELHHLGEKDPITFSHFVRWVVQQEPAAMHRPWQPFSETCRFGHVKYSFIGRAEQPVKRVWQTDHAPPKPSHCTRGRAM